MNCQRCNSDRVVNINAKASDLFLVLIGDKEENGYLPKDMGIGGGDYLAMDYCLECGQVQGKFPLPITELENKEMPEWVIQHTKQENQFWNVERNRWVSWSEDVTELTNEEKENTYLPHFAQFIRMSDLWDR